MTWTPLLLGNAKAATRFWGRVAFSDDCWNWSAGASDRGYGVFGGYGHHTRYTHRLVWEWWNDQPIGERDICHRCDNPKCVNPSHLFAGTCLDNMADMVAKGRGRKPTATHCKRGHEFTPENTRTFARTDGVGYIKRVCRTCFRDKDRVYQRERRRSRRALAT